MKVLTDEEIEQKVIHAAAWGYCLAHWEHHNHATDGDSRHDCPGPCRTCLEWARNDILRGPRVKGSPVARADMVQVKG